MTVKDAVKQAMEYVIDLYENSSISNLGLEEVEFDSENHEWIVTIGFSRPWDYPEGKLAVLASDRGLPKRTFKTVRISDKNWEVIAIKNYAMSE